MTDQESRPMQSADDEGGDEARSRSRSPYWGLPQTLELARVLYDKGGGSLTREQLCAHLGYNNTRSGAFLSRVGAARMFGLIEGTEPIVLSERSKQILFGTDAAKQEGLVEAFFKVGLYEDLYNLFKGQPLPSADGLRGILETTFGIPKERTGSVLKLFLDAADTAGFFRALGNRSRLVAPTRTVAREAGNSEASVADAPAGQSRIDTATRPIRSVAEMPQIPPAILGLLSKMPAEGTALSAKRKTQLVAAFTAALDWLYPDEEDATGAG